jgi:hypothetical protein
MITLPLTQWWDASIQFGCMFVQPFTRHYTVYEDVDVHVNLDLVKMVTYCDMIHDR